jgi:signal peptidase I
MLICFLTVISSSLITIILALIGFGMLSQILSTVIVFFIFNYLFKKYYQASWKKALGVYVANIVVGAIITLVIVVPIRLFVAEPFVVAGQGMSPNLNHGDYLIINKIVRNYKRDDVIVFKSSSRQAYIIKRVIGLPTEKITLKDGQLFVNGTQLSDPFIVSSIQGDLDITLATDEYFVLSDNAASSIDSRTFGPIKSSAIVGKVI